MELDHDKNRTPAESGYAGLETEISSLELLMVGRHKRVLERVLNPTRVTPLTLPLTRLTKPIGPIRTFAQKIHAYSRACTRRLSADRRVGS